MRLCIVCERPAERELLCRLCRRSFRDVNYTQYDAIEWAAKRARYFFIKNLKGKK